MAADLQEPLSAQTRARSGHRTRRIPRAGDAWTHSLGVSAPPVERTICPALVRTVRRPSFTGPIALFRHRLSRIRFPAAMGLIGVVIQGLRSGQLQAALPLRGATKMSRSTRGQNPALLQWPLRCCGGRPSRATVRADPSPIRTSDRRISDGPDAWTHILGVSAPPVERTICPALVRTVTQAQFCRPNRAFWAPFAKNPISRGKEPVWGGTSCPPPCSKC